MLQIEGLKENELLAPYTTFGIGGIARFFIEVDGPEALIGAVLFAKEKKLPYVIIAGGSNVVISDEIFPGLVIRVWGGKIQSSREYAELSQYTNIRNDGHAVDDLEIIADAGVSLSSLVEYTVERGLAGLEMLSGIPGTVGGAIIGNAGAYGQAIGERVIGVEIYDHAQKRRHFLSANDCDFLYRDSRFKRDLKDLVLLRAHFCFDESDKEALVRKSKEIIAVRAKKYTSETRTPGSFFKNLRLEDLPEELRQTIPNLKDFYGKVPAWYFLNEVGARGMCHGGLRIADFHGNYIMNTGGATYKEVREFAEELKRRVREKFGVELKEEVRYVEPSA